MAIRISNALAILAADAYVDSVDDGAGAGTLEIRTGAAPTNCEDADTGTLLATLTFSDPAFGAASDAAPGGQATANAITADSSADATGTAAHFRVKDSDSVVKWQGAVTATGGGGDLELDSVAVSAGVQVSVTSLTFTQPEA